MKLLLDSHTYLWWLGDHPKLSPAARAALADPANVVLVSAASIWEIEAKRATRLLRPVFPITMAIPSSACLSPRLSSKA